MTISNIKISKFPAATQQDLSVLMQDVIKKISDIESSLELIEERQIMVLKILNNLKEDKRNNKAIFESWIQIEIKLKTLEKKIQIVEKTYAKTYQETLEKIEDVQMQILQLRIKFIHPQKSVTITSAKSTFPTLKI